MSSQAWVCLNYHEIVDETDPVPHFGLRANAFAAQLDWLAAHGYRGETMEAAAAARDRLVVGITFDDGQRTHFTNAFPILVARGMRATFFITTDWVGRPGRVTWDELRAMAVLGMSIQSHTASHAFLSTIPPEEVREELLRSKAALDLELSQDTRALALPGGDEPRAEGYRLFDELGYRTVATSRPRRNGPGSGTGPTIVNRFTVRAGQPPDHFCKLVAQHSATLATIGLRAAVVAAGPALLGRSRYAEWRRRLLGVLPGLGRRLGS